MRLKGAADEFEFDSYMRDRASARPLREVAPRVIPAWWWEWLLAFLAGDWQVGRAAG